MREGAGVGIRNAGFLLKAILGFGILNFAIIVYAVYAMLGSDVNFSKILFILLIALVGTVFTAIAGYKAYQLVILNVLEMLYKRSSNIFLSLCHKLIDHADEIRIGNSKLLSDTRVLDLKSWVTEKFEWVPAMFRKIFVKLLSRIPLVPMLQDMNNDLVHNNKEAAASKLYSKLDDFIMETYFGTSKIRWFGILLLINLLIQSAIIYLKVQ
jgi:hypothetical protein